MFWLLVECLRWVRFICNSTGFGHHHRDETSMFVAFCRKASLGEFYFVMVKWPHVLQDIKLKVGKKRAGSWRCTETSDDEKGGVDICARICLMAYTYQ